MVPGVAVAKASVDPVVPVTPVASVTSVTSATLTPPSPDDPGDAALLQRPRDDQPLDLGRAFPDPIDPQLAEESFGRVLSHVAASAEHLDDAVRTAEGGLRREQLREGC